MLVWVEVAVESVVPGEVFLEEELVAEREEAAANADELIGDEEGALMNPAAPRYWVGQPLPQGSTSQQPWNPDAVQRYQFPLSGHCPLPPYDAPLIPRPVARRSASGQVP